MEKQELELLEESNLDLSAELAHMNAVMAEDMEEVASPVVDAEEVEEVEVIMEEK